MQYISTRKNMTMKRPTSFSKQKREYIRPVDITASSEKEEYALDNGFATLWETADNDNTPDLTIGFDGNKRIDSMEIRFEYPWKEYKVKN